MKKFPIPKTIQRFASVFHDHTYRLFVVGGAVRDYLLGSHVGDFDFATDASPEQVMSMFRAVIPTGIEHGTVTVLFSNRQFEVTTFRTEAGYSDARHPDSVTFVADLEEDLSRRDFTINALAADTATGRIIDLHHGLEDLSERRLRAIGNPEERFCEDSLRILRGFRFLSTLEAEFESGTLEAAQKLAHTITGVSAERIREELNKILASKTPSRSLEPMHEYGLLKYIIPELDECVGVGQKGIHAYDVFTHSIAACDGAERTNRVVRWAALLHDIGKKDAEVTIEDGESEFHNHEFISAELSDTILRRLKFSNQEREQILHLIRNHMFKYTPDWSDAALRRFIARVGEKNLSNLAKLSFADAYGKERRAPDPRFLDELSERIDQVTAEDHAFSTKDLAVDGRDIMALGIPQGKVIGIILNELLETVLDDPKENTREHLLEIARNVYVTKVKG